MIVCLSQFRDHQGCEAQHSRFSRTWLSMVLCNMSVRQVTYRSISADVVKGGCSPSLGGSKPSWIHACETLEENASQST